MFEVKSCTQEEYDFLRVMGRHRKCLTISVLDAIGEKGSIDWEDHSYSSICENGELLHPSFGFLKKLLPDSKVTFSDYYDAHPVRKPLRSLWDAIGKTSIGTIVLLSVKSCPDPFGSERLDAVAYLSGKGMPVKYVELILIADSFLSSRYEQAKLNWTEELGHRNKCHSDGEHMYFCFMSISEGLEHEE